MSIAADSCEKLSKKKIFTHSVSNFGINTHFSAAKSQQNAVAHYRTLPNHKSLDSIGIVLKMKCCRLEIKNIKIRCASNLLFFCCFLLKFIFGWSKFFLFLFLMTCCATVRNFFNPSTDLCHTFSYITLIVFSARIQQKHKNVRKKIYEEEERKKKKNNVRSTRTKTKYTNRIQ